VDENKECTTRLNRVCETNKQLGHILIFIIEDVGTDEVAAVRDESDTFCV